MDFKEMYAQKKMTAEQAAALVKSGDWVDYGWCVNTPVAVDAALAKRLPELDNCSEYYYEAEQLMPEDED